MKYGGRREESFAVEPVICIIAQTRHEKYARRQIATMSFVVFENTHLHFLLVSFFLAEIIVCVLVYLPAARPIVSLELYDNVCFCPVVVKLLER